MLFIAFPVVLALSIPNFSDPVVELEYGSYRGRESAEGKTLTFYGIPFAAPPVGALRFRPPQQVVNVRHLGVQDATKPGPSCMLSDSFVMNVLANPSEDCLQLNIVRPNNKALVNLPVIVHVYGGKFVGGYNSYRVPNNRFPYAPGSRSLIMHGKNVFLI